VLRGGRPRRSASDAGPLQLLSAQRELPASMRAFSTGRAALRPVVCDTGGISRPPRPAELSAARWIVAHGKPHDRLESFLFSKSEVATVGWSCA
jgi:hypothetical protein